MSEDQHVSTGTLPDDFVGAENHGPGLSETVAEAARRSIQSGAWGGGAREISSEFGVYCSYCGKAWTSNVGMKPNTHPGMDISMPSGTKLYAAAAGRVVFAGWSERWYRPRQVQIQTPDGQFHIYAHMRSVVVAAGTDVAKGDYLGTSGEQTKEGTDIPDGTGAHLHFEPRRTSDNRALDPEPILTDDSSPQRPAFATGDRIRADVDDLNFRDQPTTATTVSGTSNVIGKLASGTELCVTGASRDADGYTWYPVRDADGRKGWVAGKLCSLVSANACGFEAGDRITVNESGLRLRSAVGLKSSVLEQLAAGFELCVSGAPKDADNHTWYPVRKTDGASGWVAGRFCELAEAGGCGNITQTPGSEDSWPTVDAIDNRIAMSNKANGRTSKLTGMGAAFIVLGRTYGINPGIVCAIAQRECQLGADGSHLPTNLNNFGGNTAGKNQQNAGTCGAEFFKDRHWQKFCTAEEGLEGIFRTLDKPGYRQTGGRFEDVMRRYSPPDDGNPWPPKNPNIWQTFTAVAEQLGISIDFDTQVYI